MRSTAAVMAGLAAVASADLLTVTHTQDVTVTYCAPTVTNCPAYHPYNTWGDAPVPAKPTGKPWGKPPGGWDNWEDVPEAYRTWDEWHAKPSAEWVPYSGGKPGYKPKPDYKPKPGYKPEGEWDDWENVPEPQRTWDEWKAKPTAEWVPYNPVKPGDKPMKPYNKPQGEWNEWENVPEPQRTWDEWKAKPTAEWVPYTPAKPDTPAGKPDTPAGKPPGGWADWKDVPEAQRTWAEWKAKPTNEWVPYTPVKGDDKPKVPAANTWQAAPAPTATWADVKGADSKVAKYTGAANTNSGSFIMAGLAGLVAMLI